MTFVWVARPGYERRMRSGSSAIPIALTCALGGVVAPLAGCDGGGSDAAGGGAGALLDELGPPTGEGRVAVRFEARVGAAPVDCVSRYPDLGVPGSNAGIRDLRIYVHDLRLIAEDGTQVPVTLDQDGATQLETLALLDFEDGTANCERGTPERHAVITGVAERGSYTGQLSGLAFRVGVPFEQNHIDITGAPPPLDLTALFWGWGDGRIFLSASTSVDDGDGSPRVFSVQLASTGCEGDPRMGEVVSCAQPNRGEIVLPAFDAATDVVVVDLAALLQGTDVVGGSSCHAGSDDVACQRMIGALGVDPVSGAPSPGTQTLFRVEKP